MRRWSYLLTSTLLVLTGPATYSGATARQVERVARGTANPPVSGKKTPGIQSLDKVMLDHLDQLKCTCATLAISYQGRLVHSRAYGWADREKKVPAQPMTIIGIASCEKPITSAAIRQLARKGKLNLDDNVFEVLGIKPRGQVVDGRVHRITLRNLLDHKAGWQGEPINRALKAARESGKTDRPAIEAALGFVMIQKLSSDPGAKYEYCNSCFDTLRLVIEKTSKMPPVDYFRTQLFKPFGINEMKGFASPDTRRPDADQSIVWNDREGGPVGASAPTLCNFMQRFWITGEPRDRSNPKWVKYGGLPASTALMIWRSDGINVVALFNGRSDSHDRIKDDLEAVIDRLK